MEWQNIALEGGVSNAYPPFHAATFSAFIEKEQGFWLSHCSTSMAKNLQILTIVNMRQESSFGCTPLSIASVCAVACYHKVSYHT